MSGMIWCLFDKLLLSPFPAMTSAKVKAVNKGVDKSVFHRKADSKTETLSKAEKDQQVNTGVQDEEETSSFVFTPAKEEFCFNFL